MSAKSWMPFYVADYLADTGHLTTSEHGAYLLLIFHYWQRGALPNDDSRLAGIARLSLSEWLAIRSTVKEFFSEGWRHARVDSEKATSLERHERRVNAGRRGGEAKAASSNASAAPVATLEQGHTQPQPQPQPQLKPEKKAPAKKASKFAYSDDYEKFWAGYPDKTNQSKSEAFGEWKKLSQEDRETCLASLPAFASYCAKNPDYTMLHAVRYIRHRRFDGYAEAVAAREIVSRAEPVISLVVQSPAWEAACRALAARDGVAKFNAWIGQGTLVKADPYRFELPTNFLVVQCRTFFADFFETQLSARVTFAVAPQQ